MSQNDLWLELMPGVITIIQQHQDLILICPTGKPTPLARAVAMALHGQPDRSRRIAQLGCQACQEYLLWRQTQVSPSVTTGLDELQAIWESMRTHEKTPAVDSLEGRVKALCQLTEWVGSNWDLDLWVESTDAAYAADGS